MAVGTYEGGGLIYRGRIDAGITRPQQRALLDVLAAAQARRRPKIYGMSRDEMRDVRWVQPRLIAQIDFFDTTADGRLARPSLRDIRDDEDACGVHLEVS